MAAGQQVTAPVRSDPVAMRPRKMIANPFAMPTIIRPATIKFAIGSPGAQSHRAVVAVMAAQDVARGQPAGSARCSRHDECKLSRLTSARK